MRQLNTKYHIAIVGSGVVGKATGSILVKQGFDVSFLDINPIVINELILNGYKAYLPDEFDSSRIDVYFVSVQTYTDPNDDGLSYLKNSCDKLAQWIKTRNKYTLIVIRSTILPGTIEEVLIPIIKNSSGKKPGMDFDVCFNPEFLRETSALSDFENPWIVVIGTNNDKPGDILEEIYFWVKCKIYRVSIKESETQKFIHNMINASKISFFNEMRLVCDRLNLDADIVFDLTSKSAEAMWNPSYGIANKGSFRGKCLPKDTKAFLNYANNHLGINLKMLKAVIDVNNMMGKINPTKDSKS